MKFPHSIISLLVVSVTLISCLPNEDFPKEPVLEYTGFSIADTVNGVDPLGYVHLRFTDGDGNVGLDEADTLGVFHPDSAFGKNLFIFPFKKIGGEFVTAESFAPNHVRIAPRLSDSDDPMEGDIDAGLFIPAKTALDSFDTVILRWEIYLVDRDRNMSNVITTPEFEFAWP